MSVAVGCPGAAATRVETVRTPSSTPNPCSRTSRPVDLITGGLMSSYQQPSAHAAEPSIKDRATEAMDQGRQAAGDVAGTATEQVQQVKEQAVQQARDLVGEARQHVDRQVSDQHRSLVANLRSLSGELGSMVDRSDQSGTATQLVGQARQRMDGVADWLDARQPGDVVNELKNFARRRPGTFLLGALAAGVVAGRLTRGAVAAHTDQQPSGQHAADGSAGIPAVPGDTAAVPGETAAGYAMGGSYTDPADQPGTELGYGATSTYGNGGAQPYPPAGYPEGGPVR
jgi:hypothetical protein